MVARLKYEVVDVFTDRPYAGNPLAVVLDADGVEPGQMQAIAREFHLSETTFVLPPVAGGDYRIRIFTPAAEIPFAGHPSVGTAVTLARLGRISTGDVVQECGAGQLPVVVSDGRATLTGGTPVVGEPVDPAPLLAAVGLTDEDFTGVPPRRTSCGLDTVTLAVRPEALAQVVPDLAALRLIGCNLAVSAWDAATSTAHSRVFAADLGVPEDPATGSAALAYGLWLVASGLVSGDGESAYTVRQGIELGRPSTLECTVTASGGQPVRATVSGAVAAVASGEIQVPPFFG